MMHQPAQNQSGCPAASVQVPDTLHIDLPHADPEKVNFTIIKCLVQMSKQHLDLMKDGFVSGAAMTVLASSCMDMIQVFAESILDDVMPQVYRYMTTYGTFSPSVLGLTEGRIHTYLGDSIEQALAKALKIKVQNFEATKKFHQLLLRHISKAVNSVLALTTKTPTLESRLPVFFVSGCVTSTGELLDIVCQITTILTGALEARQHVMTEAQRSLNASYEPGREVFSPIFCFNYRRDLKEMVKAYISCMVKILKSAQLPNSVTSFSNHRGVCIRVGTNTQMLNVEDRDSDRQESSCYGSDVIPGAVSDNDKTESHSESCPFSSVTVIAAHQSSPNEMESIKNIAEELVEAFSAEDLQGSVQGHSSQQSVHSGLVVKDTVKLRELTDRIFNVVMSGHDYQIPSVPDGTRMCNTVTYRKLRGEGLTDPGPTAHALYLRTEEVVTRCAMQVLLWSQVYSEQSDYSTPITSAELPDLTDLTDFMFVPGNMGGDRLEVVADSTASFSSLSLEHPDSNITFDVDSGPLEMTQPQILGGIVPAFLLPVLVGEMFNVIGISNMDTILDLAKKATEQLRDLEPQLYNHLHVSLRGRSYKDIYQAAISDLLLEFSSLQELQEAVRSGDASFEEAIMRALRKQLTIPTSLEPNGNTAKKPTCSFFRKLRKLCCYKKRSDKVTALIPLAMDQDSNELQEYFSEAESLKDEPKQCQCPPTSSIAASIQHMYSSSKKTTGG